MYASADENGEVDMELTGELFDYAVRHGVNYFDTAWPYLGGKSETATGALLKNIRATVFIWPTNVRHG